MPPLLWLSLLFGYLAGVAGALVVLPGPTLEPFQGRLVVIGLLLAIAAIVAVILSHRRGAVSWNDLRMWAAQTEPALPEHDDPVAPRVARTAARSTPPVASSESVEADKPAPVLVRRRPSGPLTSAVLRRALYERRVDALVRPLVNLTNPDRPVRHAIPRLCTAEGEHLEPAQYLAVAARAGLIGLIDRVLVIRAAQLIRQVVAEGGDIWVVCGMVSPASVTDAGFLGEIDELLSNYPELSGRLVLELDRLQLGRPVTRTLARLRGRGLRLGLRRLTLHGLDPGELRQLGIDLVRLDTAVTSEGPTEERRRLYRLAEDLALAGIELVTSRPDEPPTEVVTSARIAEAEQGAIQQDAA